MARWGVPGPPQFGGAPITNIRNVTSPHWRGWLGKNHRCVVPATSFCEYADIQRVGEAQQPLLDPVGNDVIGVAAVDRGDRDHRLVERIDHPRNDGLDSRDDRARGDDRVTRPVRQRGVAARSLDDDGEGLGGSHRAAPRDPEFADRHSRPIVHRRP